MSQVELILRNIELVQNYMSYNLTSNKDCQINTILPFMFVEMNSGSILEQFGPELAKPIEKIATTFNLDYYNHLVLHCLPTF